MLKPKDRQEYNEERKKEEPPVFIVIGEFPNNKDFPLGMQIRLHNWRGSKIHWAYTMKDCQGEREFLLDFFEKYPHLFKKISPIVSP